MNENNSLGLFMQKVALFVPIFKNENIDFFRNLLWAFLKNEIDVISNKKLNEAIEASGENPENFRNELIESLAELVFEDSSVNDEFIQFLRKSRNSTFENHLKFLNELSVSISRIERSNQKEFLRKHELELEEKEIEIALTNIEREERKKILKELEDKIESSTENKTNWKFVMRIAALFILVLIPVGITIFFFNGNSGSVYNGKSNNKKEDHNIIYAETGDLTGLKEIDLPSAIFTIGINYVKTNGQGFGKREEEISISLISYKNQIDYLNTKIQLIEEKYNELKVKKIKDKKNTLKSLKDIEKSCIIMNDDLKDLENTFEFKNGKLKIYKQEKIDLKSIKVYSLSNDEDIKTYYLLIGEEFFNLTNSKGKLVQIVDQELIEKLEGI